MADPARAKKRTPLQARGEAQEQCRQTPCALVEGILRGEKRYPPCNLCVHEGAVTRAFKAKGALK